MVSLRSWTLLLVGAVCVMVAAASCSATGGKASSQTSTGPGGQGGGAATSTGTTSTGTLSASSSSGGGGPSFTTSTGVTSTSSSSGGPSAACDACVAAGGTCTGSSCTLSDNTGNVDMGTQTMLQAGGSADSAFAFVYPYDKTVFPRGLTPPTLQFAGTTATAFYVTVTFPGMSYKGFYAANSVNGFALTAADWSAITLTAGATTPVSVSVTKIAGGQVSGPVTQTWTIAQGSLKGTIYYETYGSALVGSAGLGVGIMQIQPGATAPTIVKKGCGNVCHTASADGSTLVANTGTYNANNPGPTYYVSASYDLKNNASTIFQTPVGEKPSNLAFTYGGIYPDGSFVVSSTGYRTYNGFAVSAAPALYYTGAMAGTTGGTTITAPGFDGTIKSTGTPAFSPDGTMLAYNATGLPQLGGGTTLSVMSFDHSTFTFSNPRDIATHAGLTVAWPAFTPDGKWVVYGAGSSKQFETDKGNTGDLWFTSSASNTQAKLDALDGYDSNGQVYLPANDANNSFAPTVLPEAVGGYFWVVFTSHRSYGNTLASKAPLPQDPLTGQPDADSLGKLWVAAIDINATAGQDPSHPAFYLDGQELQADNLRGFWVLSPCQANGSTCTSGDECCGGFCRPGDGGGDVCNDTSGGGCSMLLESCTKASDCCDMAALCINGKCSQPPPP